MQDKKKLTVSFELDEIDDGSKIHDIIARLQQFCIDTNTIQGANKDVADKFVSSLSSTNAAVFAESEMIATKIRRSEGKIKVLSAGSASSDAYYMQEKQDGLYVRTEVKSVLRSDTSAINQEIMNAEAQHKARLVDEKGRPTWHKTVIVLGAEDNVWPFSNQEQFNKHKDSDARVLQEAANCILNCQSGLVKPKKELKVTYTDDMTRQLLAAERRFIEKQFAQQRAATPKKSTRSSLNSNITTPNPSSGYRFRSGRNIPRQPPQTPISKQRVKEQHKADKKNQNRTQEERLASKLLVTEHITVVCPHRQCTYVLDRTDNLRFHARIRHHDHGVVSETSQKMTRQPRLQWMKEGMSERDTLNRVDSEGNTALHLAVRDLAVDEVEFLCGQNKVGTKKMGTTEPIHTLAQADCCNRQQKAKAQQVLDLLLNSGVKIDEKDAQGNTVLHLACANENIAIVKLLKENSADFDIANQSGVTPRDLILESDDHELQECLGKQHGSGL